MRCPDCNAPDTGVKDSRPKADGLEIRRRRKCQKCGLRFTTVEAVVRNPRDPRSVDAQFSAARQRILATFDELRGTFVKPLEDEFDGPAYTRDRVPANP